MKKLLSAIRRGSIKWQFTSFVVGLFLVLVAFCIALIHSASQALVKENLQYVEQNRKEFQTAMTTITRQVDSAFTQLQYDTACRQMLEAASYRQITPALVKEINTALASVVLSNGSIAEVAFVSDLLKWSGLYLPEQLLAMQDALPQQRNMASLGIWYSSMPSRPNPFLVFAYPYYTGRARLGTLLISVDVYSPAAQLPTPQAPGNFLALADQKGGFCTFGGAGAPDQQLLARFGELATAARAEQSPQVLYGDGYIVQTTALPQIDGYLLSAVNSRQAQLPLDSFYLLSVIFLAVFGALLLVGVPLLYKSVIHPLNKFSRTIAFIRENRLRKLEQPLALDGCYEIRALGEDFSDLLDSINQLTGELLEQANALYEAEVLRKTAEINVLRTQINPHFLYNTLELIRAAALRGDAEQVSLITGAIGKIYRYTAKGAHLVPLQEEIDIVKSYISIQQARFSDHITTLYGVSKEAAGVPVLGMLLQPLVENAFVHGLEPKPENGVLYIGAKVEDGHLWITIRDNGVGIAPDELLSLKQQLAEEVPDVSSHLGLINTNARLRLQYGDAYGLQLASTPGDGSCVTIRLPIDQNG